MSGASFIICCMPHVFEVQSALEESSTTASYCRATAESLRPSALLAPRTHSQSMQRLRSCNRSRGYNPLLYSIRFCQQRYSSMIAAVAEAHGSSFAARKKLSCYYFSTECFHRCYFSSLSPISYKPSPEDSLADPCNLQRNVVAVKTRKTCQTKQDAN